MQHGYERYWTTRFDDGEKGSSGLQLHCAAGGKTTIVATVTFWDACGQFFIETHGRDIPVTVAEAVIKAAREQIKVG